LIIFGWGGGKFHDLGPAMPGECPNCLNPTFLHLVRATRGYLRLFLVPLVPYGTKHFLMCPICTDGVELEPAALEQVRKMVAVTSSAAAENLAPEEYIRRLATVPGPLPAPEQEVVALGQGSDPHSPPSDRSSLRPGGDAMTPEDGVFGRSEPDPTLEPSLRISGGTNVTILAMQGVWAKVETSDRVVLWVDSRRLVPPGSV
jgi:hypothetical protein